MAGVSTGLSAVDSAGNSVVAELKQVDININIHGFLAHVTADLNYGSFETDVTDGLFGFPLPKELLSSVHRCDISIGEDIEYKAEWWSKEKLKEAQDASPSSEIFQHNKEENVYLCGIGEIEANLEVKVHLEYVYTLPVENNNHARFSLPAALTPEKDAKFSFNAAVKNEYGIDFIEVDDEYMAYKCRGDPVYEAKVDFVHDYPGDREVAFKIFYRDFHNIQALCEGAADGEGEQFQNDVAMLTVYLELHSGPSNAGEFVFIVDCSGSMGGSEIKHAKETLLLFLKSLPIGCHFNVICFGSSYKFLFPKGSVEYNGDSLRTACQFQEKIDADMGGTELKYPLTQLYKKNLIKGHPRKVFLLTDGAVWNSGECINLVKRNRSTTSFSAFGIGSGVDKELVRKLAEAGGGVCDYVEAIDRSMESKVMMALRRSMMSCACDLDVNFTLPKGMIAEGIGGEKGPIFSGEPLHMFMKLEGECKAKKKEGKAVVKYTVNEKQISSTAKLKWEKSTGGVHPIHRLLAVKRMNKHIQEGRIDNHEMEYITWSCGVNIGRTDCDSTILVTNSSSGPVAVVQGSTPGGTPAAPVVPAPTPAITPTYVPRGVGRGAARRPRRVLRDNIKGINNKTIMRIARRGGVARMSKLVHEEVRGILKKFLTKIIEDTVLYTTHCRRIQVTEEDVDCALRHNGINMYGVEDRAPYIFEKAENKRVRRRGRKIAYVPVQRTTPLGSDGNTAESVASVLGVSPASRLQKTSSKARLVKEKSKSSQAAVAKVSSSTDVTDGGPSMSGSSSGTSSATRLRRASTEILPSSPTDPVSSSNESMSKPGLSRVRSNMNQTDQSRTTSQSALKRKGTRSVTKETPAIKKPKNAPQKQKGSGKGKKAAGSRTSTSGSPGGSRSSASGSASGSRSVASMRRSVTRGSRSTPVAAGHDKDFTNMITMITLQTFDGSWDMSVQLANLVGKSKTDIEAASPVNNMKLWATALGLSWLETHFGESRTEWEMIHYKGFTWINTQGQALKDAGLDVPALMTAANKMM